MAAPQVASIRARIAARPRMAGRAHPCIPACPPHAELPAGGPRAQVNNDPDPAT